MSTEKYLIVKGVAGLGNRLITLTAAIDYATKTNRKIYVDWSDGFCSEQGTNTFSKYFQLIDIEQCSNVAKIEADSYYPSVCRQLPIEYNIYDYFTAKQVKNRYLRKVLGILLKNIYKMANYRIIRGDSSTISMLYQKWQVKDSVFEEFRGDDNISAIPFGGNLSKKLTEDCCIFSDYVPLYNPQLMKKHIALQGWIEDEIMMFMKQNFLLKDSVGIHIRATDKQFNGNLYKFIEHLKKFCANKCIEHVFLATDNSKIEKIFKDEFKELLVTFPKFIPKVSNGGIHHWAKDNADSELIEEMFKESIIDMFVLSKTSYLFYQKGSTFGKISKTYQLDQENCFNWLTY